jgi:hypothetical protein
MNAAKVNDSCGGTVVPSSGSESYPNLITVGQARRRNCLKRTYATGPSVGSSRRSSASDAKLIEECSDVFLDGGLGDAKSTSDFLVGATLPNQVQDLALARA